MSVKLRMTRVGKKNRPLFRICAIESRWARDGQYLENLGFYDPYIADDQKKFRINKERVEYWLSVGAQPSETLLSFLKKAKVSGLIRSKPKKKRRKKRAARAVAGGGAAQQAAGTAKGVGTKSRKPPKKDKAPRQGAAPKQAGPAEEVAVKGGGPSE